MRNGSIFWGAALVLLGGLLLAQTTGVIPQTVAVWPIFWSLLLVWLGASLLMRSMRVRGFSRAEQASVALDGATSATVRVRFGAGELRMAAGGDSTDLLSGSFTGGLDRRASHDGSNLTVDLRVPSDSFPPFVPFYGRDRLEWSVALNPRVPLSLELEVGASRNLLDLRGLQVRDLRLQTGASATEIDFPDQAGATRASVHSGAASVDLRVPQGVAARIRATGALASVSVDTARFPRSGSEYVSPDYATAANRLDLDVETGVGAVTVR